MYQAVNVPVGTACWRPTAHTERPSARSDYRAVWEATVIELDAQRQSESYVRLYDDVLDNPKVARLDAAAFGLYCAGLVFAHRNNTDGFIPARRAAHLLDCPNSDSLIAQLTVELWDAVDGGYQVHDYLTHNPGKDDRQALAEARRRAANVRWANAHAMQVHSNGHAPAKQNYAKDKEKEKEKDIEEAIASSRQQPSGADVVVVPARAEDLLYTNMVLVFLQRLKANGVKVPPGVPRRWHDAARLLVEVDQRPLDEIAKVMEFALTDGFWRTNVLSLPTLRAKYDQLRLRMQTGTAFQGPVKVDTNRIADLVRQFKAQEEA